MGIYWLGGWGGLGSVLDRCRVSCRAHCSERLISGFTGLRNSFISPWKRATRQGFRFETWECMLYRQGDSAQALKSGGFGVGSGIPGLVSFGVKLEHRALSCGAGAVGV